MDRLMKSIVAVFAIALVFRLLEKRGLSSQGTFLGIPYSFRVPTLKGLQESFWNPRDPRILTPHFFGWGYSINIPALLRRFQ